MNTFEQLGLSRELLSAIEKLGFSEPTQIQAKAIPLIMQGKDVVGESATGSGKTLAFGCGVLEQVVPGKGLQALILAPTRELAEQVKTAIHAVAQGKQLRTLAVYGGVAIGPQIDKLPRSDVVIATPGRLLDHVQRRTINLSKIKLLVLDEADRMLDMGFIEDIERIMQACPEKRQNLFFSATISNRIKDLAHHYMHQPTFIQAVKQVDPSKLQQYYYDIPRNKKLSLLVHLLQHEKSRLVMVFCNTRRNTDFVVKNLRANDVYATAIHGGLSQNKRTKTIEQFNKGKTTVLVCTDVAARGLHIDNVSHVYNYDLPKDSTDYVHRIGRTARAGEEGKVINLLCDYHYDEFSRIMSDYRAFTIEKLDQPQLARIVVRQQDQQRGRSGGRGYGGRGHSRGRSGGHSGGRGTNRPRRRYN